MLKVITLFVCLAVISASGADKVIPAKNETVLDDLVKPAATTKPIVQAEKVIDAAASLPDASAAGNIESTTIGSSLPSSAPTATADNPSTTVSPKTTVSTESTVVQTKSTEPAKQTDPTEPTKEPIVPIKTTPPSNNSTTTTTTTPAPTSTTTTPAPTPHPDQRTGKWIVNGTKQICIVVQMAVEFNVSYIIPNKTETHLIVVPVSNVSSTATGSCGPLEQNITISWKSPGASNDSFTIHFVKNETTKQYSLHHLEVSLAPEEFVGYNKTMLLVHNASQFTTGLSNSYRCLRLQRLNLTLNGTDKVVGDLIVSDLQFQAFRGDNSTVFGLAKDCAFDTPDIVPIAVGCALAGLVVIILIAYLVGRRRSQAHGYVSM